jgi:hypothetical protein
MDYQNGKIYSIRSPHIEDYYIGSTCQLLCKRFAVHKRQYKACIFTTAKQLFDLGIDDCYIELIENYPCNNKEELRKREGELQRLHKDNIVNIRIEGRKHKEYYEDNKERIAIKDKNYCENNKERIAIRDKNYYENNKDIILEKDKIYYENNKDIILEKKKNYYENNKDIISEKHKVNFTCECGSTLRNGDKSRHQKTKKHLDFIS